MKLAIAPQRRREKRLLCSAVVASKKTVALAGLQRFLTPRRAITAVVIVVALVLSSVLLNGFVYDDDQLIVHGPVIHDWKNLPSVFGNPSMMSFSIYAGKANPLDTYRPLTIASFMWDAMLSGKQPWSYHLTNLLGHLLCVVLVYRLALLLLPDSKQRAAPLAALWFGLAPIPAEAHVWISGRYDVLSTALGLSSVLLWRHAETARSGLRSNAWRIATLSVFLLGLLSKETLVMVLPALVLWPLQQKDGSPLRRIVRGVIACWPFIAALPLYLLLRLNALGGAKTYHDANHLSIALSRAPALVLEALSQALLPTRPYLRMLKDELAQRESWELALSAAAVVVIALLVWRLRKRAPICAWSIFWFALPITPVGLITTLHWPGFGRYLYMPSAGLAVGLCWAGAHVWEIFPRLRRTFAIALTGYFLLLAFILHGVVQSYRDAPTLYVSAIENRPDLAYGYGLLAGYYSTRLQELPLAAELYERARERDPDQILYVKMLADTYLLIGKPDAADRVAQQAEQRFGANPEFALVHVRARYRDAPEIAHAYLVTCFERWPEHRGCLATLKDLLQHAQLGPRYHALTRQMLEQRGTDPRFAGPRALLQQTR